MRPANRSRTSSITSMTLTPSVGEQQRRMDANDNMSSSAGRQVVPRSALYIFGEKGQAKVP